jgi:hypothetical protein
MRQRKRKTAKAPARSLARLGQPPLSLALGRARGQRRRRAVDCASAAGEGRGQKEANEFARRFSAKTARPVALSGRRTILHVSQSSGF